MDAEGVSWEFDGLYDIDGDEIITSENKPASLEDVYIIMVKHPNKEIWANIVLADFKDAPLNG